MARPTLRPVPAALIALLLLSGAVPHGAVLAQRASRSVLTYHGGIGLSATAVRTDKARAGGFPSSGFGLQFDFMPRVNNTFALRAEAGLTVLGPLCFNEEADCSNDHDAGGRRTSSFVMASGALAAGLLTPPLLLGDGEDGLRLSLGVYGGREWIHARRGEEDCLNCFGEDLRLRGGLFVEPALEGSFFPGLGFGISYRAYHRRSDLEGRVTVRLIAASR